jgi:hypothetical protein
MFDDCDLLFEFLAQDVSMEMSAEFKDHVKRKLQDRIVAHNQNKINDLKISRTANEYKASMASRGVFMTKSDREEAQKHKDRAEKANRKINTQYNRRQRMMLRLKRDEERHKGHFVPKINYYDNNRYHVKDSNYFPSGMDPNNI